MLKNFLLPGFIYQHQSTNTKQDDRFWGIKRPHLILSATDSYRNFVGSKILVNLNPDINSHKESLQKYFTLFKHITDIMDKNKNNENILFGVNKEEL